MRKAIGILCAALAAALCSCQNTEEQAVRHVVTAELMERYQAQESQVRLIEVQVGSHESVVRAEIHEGGRAGVNRTFHCKVERSASPASPQTSWTVTTVEEGAPSPIAPK